MQTLQVQYKPNHTPVKCARCGKDLTQPHYVEGIGYLGSECYTHVNGLEKVFAKLGVWMPTAQSSAVKRVLNRLGIKYRYEFRDADNQYGIEYRLHFEGFKQQSRKSDYGKTFAQERRDFAAQLKARAAERHAA